MRAICLFTEALLAGESEGRTVVIGNPPGDHPWPPLDPDAGGMMAASPPRLKAIFPAKKPGGVTAAGRA
jgi:hypothetical protein